MPTRYRGTLRFFGARSRNLNYKNDVAQPEILNSELTSYPSSSCSSTERLVDHTQADPLIMMDEQEWRGRNFQEELPDDLSKAKAILEKYSGIPPDEVEPHLRAIVNFNQSL